MVSSFSFSIFLSVSYCKDVPIVFLLLIWTLYVQFLQKEKVDNYVTKYCIQLLILSPIPGLTRWQMYLISDLNISLQVFTVGDTSLNIQLFLLFHMHQDMTMIICILHGTFSLALVRNKACIRSTARDGVVPIMSQHLLAKLYRRKRWSTVSSCCSMQFSHV